MKQILTDALDFDSIKSNIKAFLSAQTEFTDYNFEGSVMSMLLDLLAYNTHYNLLYTNLAVNESFIDSASKRSSVVSIARSLGYMARSTRSAVATLNIVITPPINETQEVMTLPKYTKFTSIVGNINYTFSTLTDISVPKLNGSFEFTSVPVVEGTSISNTYTYTVGSKFVIPNQNIDLSTLTVDVYDANSSSSTRFYNVSDLLQVKPTDVAYFIKQRDDLFYEVYFGNDGIGKAIAIGNVIKLQYLDSAGVAANGAKSFIYQSGFRSDVTYVITTTQVAFNGTDAEAIDSIRFNAPKAFITQNRAVTASDYEFLLQESFPNIESVRVWGGQDNIPKVYGKVFVCVKPYGATTFSPSEKSIIKDSLIQKKGVIAITPEFVDPIALNIDLVVTSTYDSAKAKFTVGEMTSNIRSVLSDYNTTITKFNSTFRNSKVTTLIDNSDLSIKGSNIAATIRTEISPAFGFMSDYGRAFGIPIQFGLTSTFYSTRFFIDLTDTKYYIKDLNGILKLYSEDYLGAPVYYSDVGTIDYITGSWKIPSLYINRLFDPLFEFVFTPSSKDIAGAKNILISILPTSTINLIAE